jgi:hypothetical protein
MAGDTKGKDLGTPRTSHRLHHTVLGVFGSHDQAERALRALHEAGFSRKDLSLVVQGTEAADEIPSQAESEHATHGAERGAIIGGVLGGLVGVAALAIPGIGPVFTAGWLAAALGGAAVGAAAGGLVGAMAEMGVPKEVAQRYAQQVAHGDLLVIAHPHDEQGEATARRLLQEAGSEDVESYPYEAHPEQFPGDESYLAEAHLHEAERSMLDPSQAAKRMRVGMEVVGSDGELVGKVKQVRASNFLVNRRLRRDIYVPYSVVHDISLDEVALTIPAYEVSEREERTRPGMLAESEDWELPPLIGPLRRRPEPEQ